MVEALTRIHVLETQQDGLLRARETKRDDVRVHDQGLVRAAQPRHAVGAEDLLHVAQRDDAPLLVDHQVQTVLREVVDNRARHRVAVGEDDLRLAAVDHGVHEGRLLLRLERRVARGHERRAVRPVAAGGARLVSHGRERLTPTGPARVLWPPSPTAASSSYYAPIVDGVCLARLVCLGRLRRAHTADGREAVHDVEGGVREVAGHAAQRLGGLAALLLRSRPAEQVQRHRRFPGRGGLARHMRRTAEADQLRDPRRSALGVPQQLDESLRLVFELAFLPALAQNRLQLRRQVADHVLAHARPQQQGLEDAQYPELQLPLVGPVVDAPQQLVHHVAHVEVLQPRQEVVEYLLRGRHLDPAERQHVLHQLHLRLARYVVRRAALHGGVRDKRRQQRAFWDDRLPKGLLPPRLVIRRKPTNVGALHPGLVHTRHRGHSLRVLFRRGRRKRGAHAPYFVHDHVRQVLGHVGDQLERAAARRLNRRGLWNAAAEAAHIAHASGATVPAVPEPRAATPRRVPEPRTPESPTAIPLGATRHGVSKGGVPETRATTRRLATEPRIPESTTADRRVSKPGGDPARPVVPRRCCTSHLREAVRRRLLCRWHVPESHHRVLPAHTRRRACRRRPLLPVHRLEQVLHLISHHVTEVVPVILAVRRLVVARLHHRVVLADLVPVELVRQSDAEVLEQLQALELDIRLVSHQLVQQVVLHCWQNRRVLHDHVRDVLVHVARRRLRGCRGCSAQQAALRRAQRLLLRHVALFAALPAELGLGTRTVLSRSSVSTTHSVVTRPAPAVFPLALQVNAVPTCAVSGRAGVMTSSDSCVCVPGVCAG
ncbi:molecular chaperone SurA [Babesia caballi]|uniref:Molecular chaperone SurA n=1 Tax=Babesia caballi TaxID=5871 RepID=A0AAV4LUT2_BABCB|nr:molecular chaperone SurA [Babesia caballi]